MFGKVSKKLNRLSKVFQFSWWGCFENPWLQALHTASLKNLSKVWKVFQSLSKVSKVLKIPKSLPKVSLKSLKSYSKVSKVKVSKSLKKCKNSKKWFFILMYVLSYPSNRKCRKKWWKIWNSVCLGQLSNCCLIQGLLNLPNKNMDPGKSLEIDKRKSLLNSLVGGA